MQKTFAIFNRNITDKTQFLDIGAWIGSTSLFGAPLTRKCVAFKPDPVAFRDLSQNVTANAGPLGRSPVTPGGSEAGADSTSRALLPDSASLWAVRAQRLPDALAAHRKPNQPVFLKIDIEGGVYDLLPAIAPILADPKVTA